MKIIDTLSYCITCFIEGIACGTVSACIVKIAYPHGDGPWYVYTGMVWFAYLLWNKLKIKQ